MAKEFRLPPMSTTMVEAKIIRWLKEPGADVQVGEPLLEVESDKAAIMVESPYAGKLERIFVEAGQSVPVGAVLATIETGEGASQPAKGAEQVGGIGEVSLGGPVRVNGVEEEELAPLRSSPAARRLARELGIDLAEVQGTGPGGRITTEDVEHAARLRREAVPTTRATQEKRQETSKLSSMRAEIARVVSRSHEEIPSFWVGNYVNLEEVLRLQEAVNRGLESREEHLTLTDFFLQASADTLLAFPTFTQHVVQVEGELRLEQLPASNIGLVVALEDGLLVPVLADLAGKGLVQIARQRHAIVTAARQGQLPAHALAPAAYSISNVGNVGVERFQAIVQPGQSAILAIGSLGEYAVARGGKMFVAKGCYLTLTVDHRIIDGIQAARFLRALVDRLESGNWRLL